MWGGGRHVPVKPVVSATFVSDFFFSEDGCVSLDMST